MSSAWSGGTRWQDAAQLQRQIREQVERDVERALRQARQEQPNIDEATRAAIQGAAEGARGRAEAARAAAEAARAQAAAQAGPEVRVLPNGVGILRTPNGPVIATGVGQPMPFPPNGFPPQIVDIAIAFFIMIATVFIGTPLARAFARNMDRKSAAPGAASSPDVVARLDRIEQAVDAIALEVERVSEGQRYVTKLMSEPRALPSPNEVDANDLQVAERAASPRAAERLR